MTDSQYFQPAHPWRGLTDEERAAFVDEICEYGTGFVSPLFALVESLEGVLKTRNSAEQRQPLSPGQLQELWRPYAGAAPFSYARAIERAHGITGAQA